MNGFQKELLNNLNTPKQAQQNQIKEKQRYLKENYFPKVYQEIRERMLNAVQNGEYTSFDNYITICIYHEIEYTRWFLEWKESPAPQANSTTPKTLRIPQKRFTVYISDFDIYNFVLQEANKMFQNDNIKIEIMIDHYGGYKTIPYTFIGTICPFSVRAVFKCIMTLSKNAYSSNEDVQRRISTLYDQVDEIDTLAQNLLDMLDNDVLLDYDSIVDLQNTYDDNDVKSVKSLNNVTVNIQPLIENMSEIIFKPNIMSEKEAVLVCWEAIKRNIIQYYSAKYQNSIELCFF